VARSKVFREAVGSDALARKMKRRTGVYARLEELRILLNYCYPSFFDNDDDDASFPPLTVYFLDEEHRDSYNNGGGSGRGGAGDDNKSNVEVLRSLDKIPIVEGKSTRRGTMMPMMVGNPFGLGRRNHLPTKIDLGWCHRRLGEYISRNGHMRSGSRYGTTWALNAMAGANIQETENDADIERVVKVPSKFKPYPFPVSSTPNDRCAAFDLFSSNPV
jgi:hypothetical protein